MIAIIPNNRASNFLSFSSFTFLNETQPSVTLLNLDGFYELLVGINPMGYEYFGQFFATTNDEIYAISVSIGSRNQVTTPISISRLAPIVNGLTSFLQQNKILNFSVTNILLLMMIFAAYQQYVKTDSKSKELYPQSTKMEN